MSKRIIFGGLLGLALAFGVTGVSAQGGGYGGGSGRGYDGGYGGGYGGVYVGPGSGTGMGRNFGPGSGTGMGRCRPVRVEVCRGGAGDGRGPRCRIREELRC